LNALVTSVDGLRHGDAAGQRADWPRAIVFDMDGLLFNSETLAKDALRQAAGAAGLVLPDGFAERLIGVPADRSRQLLFEQFGPSAPADRLFADAEARLREAIAAGRLQLQPGVSELLAWIDARSLPRAVATSSSRSKAMHHLTAAGIVSRFDVVVTRDDVSHGKPWPDLYLRAAELLRREPGECLALEDSYNGVRAAHAAGMPVVMIPDLLVPDDEMRERADAILADLHALVPWIAGRNGRTGPVDVTPGRKSPR
jgi:HAD superfamily hydrolase (TIGR01509 family)